MVHENSLKKIIYITGPTASGKTDLAIELCKNIGGEIIGADSMQIYKYISIGTAKPTKEETKGCKYHFIDFVEPDSIYTVNQFKDEALQKIEELHSKGITPIVCGGTGLYINSLLYKMDFSSASYDLNFRKSLEGMDKKQLLSMLKELDEKTYNNIDKDNKRRVVRAIEICHLSGIPKSLQVVDYKEHPRDFDHRVIILNTERKVIYDRINKRVDIMMSMGFEDEVKMLMKKYPDTSYPIFKFIGYKEMVDYISGNVGKEEAVENMKRNTRRFAKRQITWFKGIKGIENLYWLDTAKGKDSLLKKTLEICS